MEEQQELELTVNKLIIHIPPSGKRLLADGQLIRKKYSMYCTLSFFCAIRRVQRMLSSLQEKCVCFFLPSLSRDSMQPSVPLGPEKRYFLLLSECGLAF